MASPDEGGAREGTRGGAEKGAEGGAERGAGVEVTTTGLILLMILSYSVMYIMSS